MLAPAGTLSDGARFIRFHPHHVHTSTAYRLSGGHTKPRKQAPRGNGILPREVMVVDQVGILLTGVIAVWLTQHKRESWRRWACILGLLGQPFWFFAAWKAEQWGILAISTL